MMRLNKKGKNPFFAFECLMKGLAMLPHKELRKYLLIPLLINLLLFTTAGVLGYYYLTGLIEHFIPDWLSWLEWILWPLFLLSFLIIGFFTFTLLANLIAAPFYTRLSAKTLRLLNDNDLPIEEQPMLKVFAAEFRRLLYVLTRMLPLLILFVIPVINVVAPVLWALFGAWCIALEFMAYPLENQGLLFAEQKQLLKTGRLAGFSFGGLSVLGLSIPLFNLIVSPAAVIAATIYIHQAAESE